jgi:hypothetical protein
VSAVKSRPRDPAFVQLDREYRLWDMLTKVSPRVLPLPPSVTPERRMELTRHWIEVLGIADHRAQQSHSQTWAQAFEAVYGEAL